jgi:hypothetical protein
VAVNGFRSPGRLGRSSRAGLRESLAEHGVGRDYAGPECARTRCRPRVVLQNDRLVVVRLRMTRPDMRSRPGTWTGAKRRFSASEVPLPRPSWARELGEPERPRTGSNGAGPCARATDLAAGVAGSCAEARPRRRAPARVRALRRDPGVEEAPERARDRVRVRVEHGSARLVDERSTGEKHPPGPLLVLAHDQVVREPELAPDRTGHCGVHVREERRLEGRLPRPFPALDARLGAVQEVEKYCSGGVASCGSWRRELPRLGSERAVRRGARAVLVPSEGVLAREGEHVAPASSAPRLRVRP